MPASSILLLESDVAAGASIEAILAGAGYTIIQTANPDEALRLATDHQLVVIDVVDGMRTSIDICAEIRATPSMSAVPVMCISASDDVEERIRFLEAGADDVMARPFDARELEARVEALLLRFQRTREVAPVISAEGVIMAKPRRAVAVYSPKGGVGTTTFSTVTTWPRLRCSFLRNVSPGGVVVSSLPGSPIPSSERTRFGSKSSCRANAPFVSG